MQPQSPKILSCISIKNGHLSTNHFLLPPPLLATLFPSLAPSLAPQIQNSEPIILDLSDHPWEAQQIFVYYLNHNILPNEDLHPKPTFDLQCLNHWLHAYGIFDTFGLTKGKNACMLRMCELVTSSDHHEGTEWSLSKADVDLIKMYSLGEGSRLRHFMWDVLSLNARTNPKMVDEKFKEFGLNPSDLMVHIVEHFRSASEEILSTMAVEAVLPPAEKEEAWVGEGAVWLLEDE